MTRPVRWLVAIVNVIGSIGLGATGAGLLGPVNSAEASSVAGVQGLTQCFATKKLMAVEFLIDRTASLPQTDPSGRRVDFAQTVAAGLASIASQGGGRIDAQATAFGVGTSTIIPFQEIDSGSVSAFSNQLEQFHSLQQDQHTDYVTALTQARTDVVTQAAAMSPDSSGADVCKAVIWLTDGQMDVHSVYAATPFFAGWYQGGTELSASNADAIQSAGLQAVCGKGGLSDQIRSSDIYLIAVGLTASGVPTDFSLLSGTATGSDQASPGQQWQGKCGAVPATGAFFSGTVRDLVEQLVPPILSNPPPPGHTVACGATPTCSIQNFFTTYPHTVDADFFLAPELVGTLTLQTTGMSFLLTPGSVVTGDGGKVVVTTGLGKYPFVDVKFKTAMPTASTWTVSGPSPFGGGSIFYTTPVLSSGLGLTPVASKAWLRNTPSSASFALTWKGGALPAGLVQPGTGTLTGSVLLNGVPSPAVPTVSRPDSTGSVALVFTPPADNPATQATVNVQGTVTLSAAEGGGSLPPVPVSSMSVDPIEVSGFPLGPPSVHLGLIHAAYSKQYDQVRGEIGQPVARTVVLQVRGAAGDSGRFCVVPAVLRPNSGPPGTVAASGTSCVAVPFGKSVTLPVLIRIPRPWAGSLNGSTIQAFSSVDTQPTVHTPFLIPVSGYVLLPPLPVQTDQGTFWLLVVLSVLLAALIWAVAAYFTARLKEADLIKGFQAPVTIRKGSADIAPLPDDPNQWKFLDDTSAGHHLTATFFPPDGGSPLDLRAPIRLVSIQDVVMRRDGYLLHGSLGAGRGRTSLSGRIGHRIRGEWVFAVPLGVEVTEETEEVSGDLFFFIKDGGEKMDSEPATVHRRAVRDLSSSLPDVLARLRRVNPAPEGDGGWPGSRPKPPDPDGVRPNPVHGGPVPVAPEFPV